MPKFSVKKPLTVFVTVLAIVILGIVAYTKMTPDLLPNMNFPYVIIVTTDPGASPEAVEKEITRPMEQSMSTLDQIKSVTSTSQNSVSMVTLEFEESVNMDSISVDIQQKITALQDGWDDTVGSPYVLKINPSMLPVMVAAVGYEGKNTYEMSEFVEEELSDKLTGISGVASIDVNGLVERQLHLLMRDEKLEELSGKLTDAINKQLDDAESQLQDARAQVVEAQEMLQDMQEETMDETAETVVYALQAALRALRNGQGESEETLAELREIRAEKELLDAQQAVFDEKIEAIRQDESLSDEEKEAKIDEIERDPEYIRVQADLAALDLRLAALGSNWENLDTDIEMEEADRQAMLELLYRLENDDDLSDIVDQVSDGLMSVTDAMMQLISANIQLELALTEIDSGLAQLESAREEALKQADMGAALNINTVSALLTAQNFSMPAGYLTEDGVSYMVSVGDSIDSQQALEDMILFDLGMEGVEPITLKDIADVFITDNGNQIYAKLDGENGVIVTFTKQSTYATAEVSNNIRARFDELEAEYPGLSFKSLMDQGDYIYLIIETILSSLAWGIVFSVLILWLFLRDIRPTIITLCSIPISLVFAIVLMHFSGVTINMISLSGLAVSVGMLVDNSVVVIENIYRLRNKGATVIQAAVSGAQQVLGAITASTLTTVCVFVPIVFVEGLTRQLFTDLALTMTYSLMASLIVALTLVPAMASGMLRKEKPVKPGVLDRIAPYYRKAVAWSLNHKVVVLLLSFALLVSSAGLTLARGFTFMPNIDMNMLNLTITMPEGIEREEAVKLADEVLKRAASVEDVETVGATMNGSGTNVLNMNASAGGTYDVTAYITLPEGKFGSVAGKKIMELCEDLDCTVVATGPLDMMTMLTGSGVTLEVYGEDMELLHQTARDLAAAMSAIPGTADVSDGLEDAAKALHISIDRDAAMKKGMTVAQIYMQVAAALTTSAEGSDMTLDGIDVGVTIEGSESARLTRDTLLDLEITADSGSSGGSMSMMGSSGGSMSSMMGSSSMGGTVSSGASNSFKLSEVATIEETVSLSSISHNEQRRYVTVSSAIAEGYNVTLVTADVKKAVAAMELPEGIRVEFQGENEMIMDAMMQLVLMLLLGVVLVYFIMVAQFQSLRSPFIVMFTIPLAFTGGFIALLLSGIELSVISLIGFVMLVGIIVNNGIVLVDYINQLRLEGMERREAIIEAGITRLRPILMTSITTILGLVVMAFAKNAGTALMQPVALVCIGGLTYATLMTLLVVPCMYDILANRDLRKVDEDDLKLLDI
ncbi:MAG: efflux RND transporter permease subunit [Oscillospiraceae bacterium]|nr:efflux RND transporter permease subunit [Oscillospiraceae bacterium]